MYRHHFGLARHPFSNEVEPEDLFPAAAAKELEVRLNHLLELRGIGLVTGDAGSGKTCGARRVLAQRIVVRYHLPALSRDELPAYLAHRLRHAGTQLALFEPAAEEALFQATGGLPRKLNLLAHHALLAAALSRAKTITAEHVQAALPEVM